jgi:membrane-associated protein
MDFAQLAHLFHSAIDMLLHLDQHLNDWMNYFGPWMYVVLFLIIFCETGLVVTPFLPGDSLLFALGALCARPDSALDVWALWILLMIAGIVGDAVNYSCGAYVGPKVFSRPEGRFLNQSHLRKTQLFYERYGGKTIIIARFLPIIRTFAPFVAGIGRMTYAKFAMFNVVGAVLWVTSFLFAGYVFGNLPSVKSNFHYIILAIIILSVMPPLIEWFRASQGRQVKER